jgi:hypothetical protein
MSCWLLYDQWANYATFRDVVFLHNGQKINWALKLGFQVIEKAKMCAKSLQLATEI